MISKKKPNDWRDLQNMVSQILIECGLRVEIEKKITSIRGKIEVDVFAEETVHNRPYTILCECKYWKSKIPQTIIHGFRTVVSDTGANIGYIISSAGFQKGSFESSSKTNIKLLTWEQFQEEYKETWIKNYFIPTITNKLDPLFTYTEPLGPAWYPSLTDNEKRSFLALDDKYESFGITMFMLSSWGPMAFYGDRYIDLPLIGHLERNSRTDIKSFKIPKDILEETGYREFLDKVLSYGEMAISEYRSLRDAALSRG